MMYGLITDIGISCHKNWQECHAASTQDENDPQDCKHIVTDLAPDGCSSTWWSWRSLWSPLNSCRPLLSRWCWLRLLQQIKHPSFFLVTSKNWQSLSTMIFSSDDSIQQYFKHINFFSFQRITTYSLRCVSILLWWWDLCLPMTARTVPTVLWLWEGSSIWDRSSDRSQKTTWVLETDWGHLKARECKAWKKCLMKSVVLSHKLDKTMQRKLALWCYNRHWNVRFYNKYWNMKYNKLQDKGYYNKDWDMRYNKYWGHEI